MCTGELRLKIAALYFMEIEIRIEKKERNE